MNDNFLNKFDFNFRINLLSLITCSLFEKDLKLIVDVIVVEAVQLWQCSIIISFQYD